MLLCHMCVLYKVLQAVSEITLDDDLKFQRVERYKFSCEDELVSIPLESLDLELFFFLILYR